MDHPYTKVNPYRASPLTALVIFRTDKAAKVSYTVVGKSAKTSITNTVNGGYQKVHQVPVVGLYADYANQVKITYRNGQTTTKTLTLQTGKLPKTLSQADIKVTKSDQSKMAIGQNTLTLINRTAQEPYAIDADGQIRWYSTKWSQHTFVQLSNGHLLMQNRTSKTAKSYNVLTETDYLGRIYRQYKFSGKLGKGSEESTITAVHHDVVELPNHNLLVTISDGGKYVEDVLAEVDRTSGKVVKAIDLKRLLPVTMYRNYHQTSSRSGKVDWLHVNALWYDQKTGNVLSSARNQDLNMSFNYQTEKINWIYSGKKAASWPKKWRKYLLTPTKGTTITGGQHGLTLLSEHGQQLKILLYNNNINVTNGNAKTSGKYSEAVAYTIDLSKMSIKQTWSYGKTLGTANFTRVIGYDQRLSNGNTLIDFGYKQNEQESNIIEVDAEGNQVFNVTLKASATNRTYAYRAYRLNFYPSNYQFDATK